MNLISSRDNPRYKALVKLSESARERNKKQQVLLEGAHLVQAYQQKFGSQGVLLLAERVIHTAEVQALRLAYDSEILCLADKLFDALSELAAPSGVMAVVPTPVYMAGKDIQLALLVDGVQDPGNLGTLIRSAAAARCDAIYLSKTSADAWSPKALRAAQGAHFWLDIVEAADLPQIAQNFSGQVLAAAPNAATSITHCDLRGAVMIALGSEGSGVSPALLAACDDAVSIPMPGQFESLNVAVAGSIILFERVRQLAV